MYELELSVYMRNLLWQSDWNGYEVGYPEVPVVGLYTHYNEDTGDQIGLYIDIENQRILDMWVEAKGDE